MIDFNNASFLKLRPVPGDAYAPMLTPMLIDGEQIISSYQSIRDGVVFTNKRIFAVNVQGLTGKKKDFTILPYSKIQLFSIETSGVLDIDSELELYFSSVGKIIFEFTGGSDIVRIGQAISEYIL